MSAPTPTDSTGHPCPVINLREYARAAATPADPIGATNDEIVIAMIDDLVLCRELAPSPTAELWWMSRALDDVADRADPEEIRAIAGALVAAAARLAP